MEGLQTLSMYFLVPQKANVSNFDAWNTPYFLFFFFFETFCGGSIPLPPMALPLTKCKYSHPESRSDRKDKVPI